MRKTFTCMHVHIWNLIHVKTKRAMQRNTQVQKLYKNKHRELNETGFIVLDLNE